MGMHPTMSSRDAMKALLDEPMQGIEFNLYAVSQFYIDSKMKKKINTNVVEIHVPSSDADRARELLSIAWQHTPFLEELATHSVGMPIEFIPNIKRGVMKIDTFRKTLRLQHEFATKTLAISVKGIGGLEVEIDQRGTKITLANMIMKLTDDDGKPLFFGVEPTKLTHTDGCYLLLTKKDLIDKAEQKFDNFIEELANQGHYDSFSMAGHHIHCINQVKSKSVSTHAQSLKARFGLPDVVRISTGNPPTPTRNAWKRTPTLKVTQENFPDLPTPSRCHIDKRLHTENGSSDATTIAADDDSLSPPSLGMTQTALTDECTEFQSTIVNLQNSFSKAFNEIKINGDKRANEFETRIKEAEQAYVNAQMTMLTEFKTVMDKYNNVLESFTSLRSNVHNAQIVQDQCHLGTQHSLSSMMQILVNINQNLANGTTPEPLSQEHVNSLVQSFQAHDPRDGAPGTKNTHSSSTDLNGGGQS
jgi:hypothetical protein